MTAVEYTWLRTADIVSRLGRKKPRSAQGSTALELEERA